MRQFTRYRSLFRDLRFTSVFIASAIGTFPLFVPPFVLPLLGRTIGLSTTSAAGLVAGYNLASAIGRIAFGQLADAVGPVNSLIISQSINLVCFLAIWPFSATIGPLTVFVIVTGVSAGESAPGYSRERQISDGDRSVLLLDADHRGQPRGAITDGLGNEHDVYGLGRRISSCTSTPWCGISLTTQGAPIAGYILQASGGESRGIKPYRPAGYYAGGLVAFSVILIVAMKLRTVKSLRMRM